MLYVLGNDYLYSPKREKTFVSHLQYQCSGYSVKRPLLQVCVPYYSLCHYPGRKPFIDYKIICDVLSVTSPWPGLVK